jgi:hypothetical protein
MRFGRHVLIAAMLLLAGCGGSSGSSTGQGTAATGSGPATHAQFTAQAEAICRALRAEEAALKQRVAGLEKVSGSQEKAAAPLIGQIVALDRAADERLTALSEPPNDAASIGRLVAGLFQETDDASKIEQGFTTGDRPGAEAAEKALFVTHARDQTLAHRLGLQACVSESELE